jgi:hypothetical protein
MLIKIHTLYSWLIFFCSHIIGIFELFFNECMHKNIYFFRSVFHLVVFTAYKHCTSMDIMQSKQYLCQRYLSRMSRKEQKKERSINMVSVRRRLNDVHKYLKILYFFHFIAARNFDVIFNKFALTICDRDAKTPFCLNCISKAYYFLFFYWYSRLLFYFTCSVFMSISFFRMYH